MARVCRLLPSLVLLTGLLLTGCRRPQAPAAVDAALSSCLDRETLAVAGVNLDRLRASSLYAKLPAASSAVLEPLRAASYLLVAYDGTEFLAAAQGRFREAPAGSELLGDGIAVFGSTAALKRAKAQHAVGRTGAGWLLERAAGVSNNPVWVAARGGVTFPLTGNATNLNRLLRLAEYETVALKLGPVVELEAAAAGHNPENARNLEETLRGFFSLAAAGVAHEPDLAALLRSAQVRREGADVTASLRATSEQVARIVALAARP